MYHVFAKIRTTLPLLGRGSSRAGVAVGVTESNRKVDELSRESGGAKGLGASEGVDGLRRAPSGQKLARGRLRRAWHHEQLER